MDTRKVNVKESKVQWTGKKIAGKHHGSINLKDGYLQFEDDVLKGGEIIIDMKSIDSEDLTGESKEKLEGHLHSDDFFNTNHYETATMKITEVNKSGNNYDVMGDLEIKGAKSPVKFDLEVSENTALTKFKVDRTKYGIRYASGSFFGNLGDNVIHDNFILDVNLKF